MKIQAWLLATSGLFVCLLVLGTPHAADLSIPNQFSAGEVARAADVNANFNAVEAAVDDNHSRIGDQANSLNDLEQRVEANENASDGHTSRLTLLEASDADKQQRLSDLEGLNAGQRITDLESSEADHEQRLANLESSSAGFANVITVAKAGGDFTSVAAALNSISGAAVDNPYLVRVMPGVFDEADPVTVPGFVHLRGAGPGTTVITSNRGTSPEGAGAATLVLANNARVSDLTVRNGNTNPLRYALGIYSINASRHTVIENVIVDVNGASGFQHWAIYLFNANITIRNSWLMASGAGGNINAMNVALLLGANSGPGPRVESSKLLAGNGARDAASCNGNSDTGFGVFGGGSLEIHHSYLCGDRRAITVVSGGNPVVHHSELRVGSSAGAILIETRDTGVASITHSGVFYSGNKHTGSGGLVCSFNYGTGMLPLSNGDTAATSCN